MSERSDAVAYLEFEAGAAQITTYEPLCIPGLLQTPAYATALVRGSLIRDAAQVERLVELRMQRQTLLAHQDPPHLRAVIDETALIRPFGTAADRREQLQRLIDTESLDHVTVQVLPFEAGLHAGTAGPFAILDFREDYPTIVYIEAPPSSLFLEGMDEVRRFMRIFRHLSATALGPGASIEFLRKMAGELRATMSSPSPVISRNWRKSRYSTADASGDCVEVGVAAGAESGQISSSARTASASTMR